MVDVWIGDVNTYMRVHSLQRRWWRYSGVTAQRGSLVCDLDIPCSVILRIYYRNGLSPPAHGRPAVIPPSPRNQIVRHRAGQTSECSRGGIRHPWDRTTLLASILACSGSTALSIPCCRPSKLHGERNKLQGMPRSENRHCIDAQCEYM